jgi:hypothetical protein
MLRAHYALNFGDKIFARHYHLARLPCFYYRIGLF